MKNNQHLFNWLIIPLVTAALFLVVASWAPSRPAQADPSPQTMADMIGADAGESPHTTLNTINRSEMELAVAHQDTSQRSQATRRTIAEMNAPTPLPSRGRVVTPLSPALPIQRNEKSSRGLELGVSSGKPGSSLLLRGQGYTPGQRVRLFWDGENVTGRQFILTDPSGSFAWTFDVPSLATSGEHTIMALEASPVAVALAGDSDIVSHSSAIFTVVDGLPPGTSLPAASSITPDASLPPIVQQDSSTVQQVSTKPWTFAVYIAGDNDLSNYADLNIQQMAQAGGTNANVNVVVLLDQNRQNSRYLEVRADSLVDVTPASVSGSNLDTGTPQTFVDFMQFIATAYPADHYAVVLWDHGSGWLALETDDVSGSYWNMADLEDALGRGLQSLGRQQYDVLIFDACMMAQYEVAYQIAEYVEVLVASEEVVPGAGTPYHLYLATLVNNGSATASDFASAVVQGYGSFYSSVSLVDGSSMDYTMSAIRLDAPSFDTLTSSIDAFATAVLHVGSGYASTIQDARDSSLSYHYPDFRDLGDFATRIRDSVPDTTVQNSAQALLNALSDPALKLGETHSSGDMSASSGLSVYLPAGTTYSAAYDLLDIKNSSWYALSQAIATGVYPDAVAPTEPTPDETAPPAAAASLNDIVYTNQSSSNQFDLYRIESVANAGDDAEKLPLLSDGYRNSYPRWSPDGRYVVYASNRGSSDSSSNLGANLFLVYATGTGTQNTARSASRMVGVSTTPTAGATLVVPQAITDLVLDGGFETYAQDDPSRAWLWESAADRYEDAALAHSGSWLAWLGYGSDDTIRQYVTIPADATSLALNFSYRIAYGDDTSDVLSAGLYDPSSGTFFESGITLSTTESDTGWQTAVVTVNSAEVTQMRGESSSACFLGQPE